MAPKKPSTCREQLSLPDDITDEDTLALHKSVLQSMKLSRDRAPYLALNTGCREADIHTDFRASIPRAIDQADVSMGSFGAKEHAKLLHMRGSRYTDLLFSTGKTAKDGHRQLLSERLDEIKTGDASAIEHMSRAIKTHDNKIQETLAEIKKRKESPKRKGENEAQYKDRILIANFAELEVERHMAEVSRILCRSLENREVDRATKANESFTEISQYWPAIQGAADERSWDSDAGTERESAGDATAHMYATRVADWVKRECSAQEAIVTRVTAAHWKPATDDSDGAKYKELKASGQTMVEQAERPVERVRECYDTDPWSADQSNIHRDLSLPLLKRTVSVNDTLPPVLNWESTLEDVVPGGGEGKRPSREV